MKLKYLFLTFLSLTAVLFFSSNSYALSAQLNNQHVLEVSAKVTKTYNNIVFTKKGGPSVESDDYDSDGRNSAVFASKGAKLTLKGSSTKITTDARHAHGVCALDDAGKGTIVKISDASIITNSDYSSGIIAIGGKVSADNITITTAGLKSYAVNLRDGSEVTISKSNLKINNSSSDLIFAYGDDNTINFSGMTFSGTISADNDASLTINLKDKSTFTGKIHTSGDVSVNIELGSTWKLTGDSYLYELENNGQIISNDYKIYEGGSDEETEIVNHEVPTAPVIATSSIKNPVQGKTYSANITATGTAPISWTVSTDNLPDGLSYSEVDDKLVISGTPTTAKKYTFKVKASNSVGSSYKSFTVTVATAPVAPTITTTALNNAVENKKYSFTLKATGTAPIVWSSDNLPTPLSLTSAGVLSGTFTEAGTHTLNIIASNDEGRVAKSLYLTVTPAKPKIITTDLASGDVESSYSFEVEFSGTIDSSDVTGLPKGLSYSDSNRYITGTPEESGTFTVKIAAKNTTGTTTKSLKLIIYAKPNITTTAFNATVNANFSFNLKAEGTTPIKWTASDTLPSGINSLSNSGALKGKFDSVGEKSFNVTASNALGDDEKEITINVRNAPPTLTGSVPQGNIDVDYSAVFTARGKGNIEITLSGDLPSGLTFSDTVDNGNDTATASLTGSPTEAHNGKISIIAENDGGAITKTFNLVVKAIKPKIETTALSTGIINNSYEDEIKTSGTKEITVTVTGLPQGLSYSNGKISGTPTAFGKFTVRITASNSVGTVTKNLTLTIYSPPSINPITTLTEATINKSYSKRFTATGTTPLKWEISDGELPEGMRINSTSGALTGAPKEWGTFDFTVYVSNIAGNDSINITDFVVQPIAPKITTSTLARGKAGDEYSAFLRASGTEPITWSIAGAPLGLSVDEETGEVSGVPLQEGTFTFNATATNPKGSVSKSIRITIAKASAAALPTSNATPNENEIKTETEIDLVYIPEVQEQELKQKSLSKIPDDYLIIAELGIISADEDGLYDFEIELDEDAPEGAELLWLAMPKDVEDSEDDEICEFYNSEGEEIETVPEDKIINISVWLEEGIIYEPVIATKKVPLK